MIIKKPPMGWNSWNTFGGEVCEKVIRDTADAMVELGYKNAGYEYVVIDDWWSERKRGADGKIAVNKEKFPSGMKALSDYIHSKGLKFGMYSCAGTMTCGGFPASFEHEYEDAQMFADWGVDYLKYDFCYKPMHAVGKLLYNKMSMALKATGRDILFSACNWGADDVETWIRSTGAHVYRSTGDIFDHFESVKFIAQSQFDKINYSATGCYNDMDMLICGMYGKGLVAKGGCTDAEYKTHFAMWCLMQSPLMIGGDITNMNDYCRNLLQNKGLIAINQDEDGRPPMMVNWNKDRPVFFKHMANGEYVLALFNLSDEDGMVGCEFFDIGVSADHGFDFVDAISGEKIGVVSENLYETIPAHDCRVYRGKFVRV
ncbi:MAG: glycoside hydrolase family 27 protein [Ruminococcaceae bacterium]|nr:glycoside hydrolase family 27 protein [Oscillospiraceae bacterium]